MTQLVLYNLKVAACIAVFYLFYKVLLSRETFHRLNRMLVVSAIVLSFLLPVCRVTVYRQVPVLPVFDTILPAETIVTEPSSAQTDPMQLLAVLFAAGAAAALVRLALSTLSVVRIIRNSRRRRLDAAATLVLLEGDAAPFSWIRWICIGERDLADNGEVIIAHEREHIRLHHSLDIIVTDLSAVMQWFNPAMWLLRAELRAIHEYEADAAVLRGGTDARQYQMLLIKKAAGERWYSVANSLNHSKLKNRITMMLRKKSSRWATARALFVLPLAGVAAAAFARTEIVPVTLAVENKVTENYSIGEIAPDNPQAKAAKTPDGDAYLMCEVMPTFNGGNINDFRTWVMYNIRYPQQAQEQGIQGQVVASFLIGADGRVENEVTILQSPDESLSAEVRRVIAKSPAWTAGMQDGKAVRVKLTMPVQFTIPDQEGSEAAGPEVNGSMDKITVVGYGAPNKTEERSDEKIVVRYEGNVSYTNAKSALWVVDGREVTEEEAKAISADDIDHMTVIKGDTAVKHYGERARDGVIQIITKKFQQDIDRRMKELNENLSSLDGKDWALRVKELNENLPSLDMDEWNRRVKELDEKLSSVVWDKQVEVSGNVSIVTSGDKPREYYIDGRRATKEEFNALPSDRIANMNIDKFDDHVRLDIKTRESGVRSESQTGRLKVFTATIESRN
ncbi:MAG: TonB family protein [Alistipes sp.]|nr:TonB family protein [Alistipes sp.]